MKRMMEKKKSGNVLPKGARPSYISRKVWYNHMSSIVVRQVLKWR